MPSGLVPYRVADGPAAPRARVPAWRRAVARALARALRASPCETRWLRRLCGGAWVRLDHPSHEVASMWLPAEIAEPSRVAVAAREVWP